MKKLIGISFAALFFLVCVRAYLPAAPPIYGGAGSVSWTQSSDVSTGVSDETGSGALVFATNPTFDAAITVADYVMLTAGGSIASSSNGEIYIAPNGSGDIKLLTDADSIVYASSGTFSLDGSGNIEIGGGLTFTGGGSLISTSNGDVTIAPNGSGDILLTSAAFSVDASGNLEAAGAGTFTGGLNSVKIIGHYVTSGVVPTATAGSVHADSTDMAGSITSVSATSTIVSFASAYSKIPVCVASAESPAVITGLSTAGFTVSAVGNLNTVSFICVGIE